MQPQHRPLAAHRVVAITSIALLFSAFLFLLLVGLSLTIIKSVYLLSVTAAVHNQPATSIATELRFGVWGVCASSVLDQPSNPGDCFGPKLGYEIPPSIISLVGVSPSIVQAILTGLLVILILHLVAAVLSVVSLILSLFLAVPALAILALISTITTALVSTVVFAVDVTLVHFAKIKVPELTNNGFTVQWGNAVWMVLAAVIFTWLATILLSARACYCCGVRRRDWYEDTNPRVEERYENMRVEEK